MCVSLSLDFDFCLLPFLLFGPSGVAVNVVVVYIYYTQYLGVDDEEHGGHPKLMQEGLAPAIALFLVREGRRSRRRRRGGGGGGGVDE